MDDYKRLGRIIILCAGVFFLLILVVGIPLSLRGCGGKKKEPTTSHNSTPKSQISKHDASSKDDLQEKRKEELLESNGGNWIEVGDMPIYYLKAPAGAKTIKLIANYEPVKLKYSDSEFGSPQSVTVKDAMEVTAKGPKIYMVVEQSGGGVDLSIMSGGNDILGEGRETTVNERYVVVISGFETSNPDNLPDTPKGTSPTDIPSDEIE